MVKVLGKECMPCVQNIHDLCEELSASQLAIDEVSCPCREPTCLEARSNAAKKLTKPSYSVPPRGHWHIRINSRGALLHIRNFLSFAESPHHHIFRKYPHAWYNPFWLSSCFILRDLHAQILSTSHIHNRHGKGNHDGFCHDNRAARPLFGRLLNHKSSLLLDDQWKASNRSQLLRCYIGNAVWLYTHDCHQKSHYRQSWQDEPYFNSLSLDADWLSHRLAFNSKTRCTGSRQKKRRES